MTVHTNTICFSSCRKQWLLIHNEQFKHSFTEIFQTEMDEGSVSFNCSLAKMKPTSNKIMLPSMYLRNQISDMWITSHPSSPHSSCKVGKAKLVPVFAHIIVVGLSIRQYAKFNDTNTKLLLMHAAAHFFELPT